ncbi:hypothetical protein, partial [Acinetobacter baumannii]|uniref:hypothetical protein n=1 Tax=Acinetobacter baumannii TaxID=470 RepID=UPI001C0649CB
MPVNRCTTQKKRSFFFLRLDRTGSTQSSGGHARRIQLFCGWDATCHGYTPVTTLLPNFPSTWSLD